MSDSDKKKPTTDGNGCEHDSIVSDVPDRHLLENIFDGVYYVDKDRVIRFWNKGAESISGYTSDQMVGKECGVAGLRHVNTEGCSMCEEDCPLIKVMRTGKPAGDRVFLHSKSGRKIPVDLHATPIFRNGEIIGAVEVFRDASAYVELEEINKQLTRMAYKDPLTDIPSRRWIMDRLKLESDRLERYGESMCIGIFDIDDFKKLNDHYGHLVGDKALKQVATHFKSNLRSSDIIGRMGGDEFLFALLNTEIPEGEKLIRRLKDTISKVATNGLQLDIKISIGLFHFEGKEDINAALGKADLALLEAKKAGKDSIYVYDPSLDKAVDIDDSFCADRSGHRV